MQALLNLDSHGACQNEMYKTKELENTWMFYLETIKSDQV